jgi:hypothetical protein
VQPRENDLDFYLRNDKQNKALLWLSVINVLLNSLTASVIAVISALSDAGYVGAVKQAVSTLSSLFT